MAAAAAPISGETGVTSPGAATNSDPVGHSCDQVQEIQPKGSGLPYDQSVTSGEDNVPLNPGDAALPMVEMVPNTLTQDKLHPLDSQEQARTSNLPEPNPNTPPLGRNLDTTPRETTRNENNLPKAFQEVKERLGDIEQSIESKFYTEDLNKVNLGLSFYAVCTAPGGYWQDDISDSQGQIGHIAGTSILAQKNPKMYWTYIFHSTFVFIISITVTLLPMLRGHSQNTNRGSTIMKFFTWASIAGVANMFTLIAVACVPRYVQHPNISGVMIVFGSLVYVVPLVVYLSMKTIYHLKEKFGQHNQVRSGAPKSLD
ncbi:hypothetical protein Drorol1_Dr00003957 [Drosera rotundifolia]